jgi:hypothetical protein
VDEEERSSKRKTIIQSNRLQADIKLLAKAANL